MSKDEIELREQIFSNNQLIDNFNCGNTQLNDFIHKEVYEYHGERLGITYLFFHETDLVGFVTISMADIKPKDLQPEDKKNIQPENYPSVQIGQLAIDLKYQRKGLGKKLIGWCMDKAVNYSEGIGCRFLVLNAVPESVEFYKKCDFKELKAQKGRIQKTMYSLIPKELFTN